MLLLFGFGGCIVYFGLCCVYFDLRYPGLDVALQFMFSGLFYCDERGLWQVVRIDT